MGKGFIIFLALLLLLVPGVEAQVGDYVWWSAEAPLQWRDFRGKPGLADAEFAAATYAGLELSVEDVAISGHVTYRVRAVFDCKRSWAHPHRTDDRVLAHEQLHFDIAAAYARRLERKLNALKLKVKDKEVAKRLLHQYNRVQQQDQERYDIECIHGLNQEKQQQWRQRFDKELRIRRPPAGLAKN